jgi:hypothetical protein
MRAVLLIILLVSSASAVELDRLVPALIEVESRGNNKAIGDNGKAYGCLQIWKVCVDDVNRVYKTNYTHNEMLYRYNSCEVATLYLTYWGKVYERRTGNKPSPEVYARIWNGGPTGYKKKATDGYWKKVQKQLNKRRKK